jgi:hypothetical protein
MVSEIRKVCRLPWCKFSAAPPMSLWPVRFAIITALFQDNPCLEDFSSEPDGLPPIEAWRLKIIINI